jgi:GTP pyrophosphokinase
MLSSRFGNALGLALDLHGSQLRKGGDVPYVAHLLATASLVLEYGGNEDEAIAGLLHDAVEDQGGEPTLEKIRRRFGDDVAEIVLGCSDSTTVPKPPWRERKERYLAHLSDASKSVRLVLAADKLHNARSIVKDYRLLGESLWERFNGGKAGTLWYYRSLVDAFRAHGSSSLVDELDRVVTQLETLSQQSA